MKYIITSILLITTIMSFGQAERKFIRKGNNEFEKQKFDESELLYRRAIEKDAETFDAAFNLGDALYKQEKYEEAARQFQMLSTKDISKEDLSKVYHNLGNSLLQGQKLEESINAYKNALKNNPSDMETKYNLAFAQSRLQQQQEQQDQDKNQDKEDQNKDQDKKDQEEDQNKKDQKKDQEKQDQQQNEQQQPKKNEISKEDAQRMLEALQNDEKKLLEKLKKQKVKSQKYIIEKEW